MAMKDPRGTWTNCKYNLFC